MSYLIIMAITWSQQLVSGFLWLWSIFWDENGVMTWGRSSVLNSYGEHVFLWVLLLSCSCASTAACLSSSQQCVLSTLPILPISIQMLTCCSSRCFPWDGMDVISLPYPHIQLLTRGEKNLSVSFNWRITSSVRSYRNLIIGFISSSFNFEMLDDAFQFKKLIFL